MKRAIKKLFQLGGLDVIQYNNEFSRYAFLYDKYKEYTMIPKEFFMLNIQLCNHFGSLQGDYVECGVWRGGMSAAIAEQLGPQRQIHLFDSFEGLPSAKEIDGKAAIAWQKDTKSPQYYDNCKAEESYVIQAMSLATHTNFQLHRGWFDKTTPLFENRPIAILRLDGDWYDSIMVCLEHLFPKVIEGGIVVLDDYHTWDGCAKAVHDYLSKNKSSSRVYQWNNQVAYIIKKN